MSGQLRDYHLLNLGVVQYVPRDFCIPEAPAADAHGTQQDISRSNASEAIASLSQATVDTGGSHQPVVSKETAVVADVTVQKPVADSPVAGTPTTDTELRFRISYWQLPDLLVFSSLDYGENPPQDQHQLLSNILQAVNRSSGVLPEPELVDWPVVPTAPAGVEAAKAMFTSLLKGRAEQTDSRWVLVMGERAQQFLLAGEAVDGRAAVSEHCQAVVTPSLDQMLADPQLKRTTWQLIRFLADIPCASST